MNEEGSPLNRDDAVAHLALLASAAVTTPSASGALPSGSAAAPARSAGTRRGGERRIYVFDREHLDANPEEVANALAITEDQVLTEPPLNRASRPSSARTACLPCR